MRKQEPSRSALPAADSAPTFVTTVLGGTVDRIVNVRADTAIFQVRSQRRPNRSGRSRGTLPYFGAVVALVRELPDYDVSPSAHRVEEIERRFLRVSPEPTVGLKIASLLAAPLAEIHDWRVRRSFALCLGRVLHECARTTPLTPRQISELFSETFDWDDRDVVLAIAATVSARAADAAGSGVLATLAGSPHPQARWQIARRLSLPAVLNASSEILTTTSTFEDLWVRRRFIISTVLAASGQLLPSDIGIRLLRPAIAIEVRREGVPWLASLVAWAGARPLVPLIEVLPAPLRRDVRDYLHDCPELGQALLSASDASDPGVLRAKLEYASLDDDRARFLAKGRRQAAAARDRGYGRYAMPRLAVAREVAASSNGVDVEILDALGVSHDEGVRWAVAAALPYVDILRDRKRLMPTLTMLLKDESPWVVRETLSSLGTTPVPADSDFLRPVMQAVTEGLRRARDAGWPDAETTGALGAFLQAAPEAGTFISVVARDG